MAKERKPKEETLIYSVWNGKSFLKVKQAFNIHKILFVIAKRKGDGTLESNIDVYLSIGAALRFANDIISYRMYRDMELKIKEQAESNGSIKYLPKVWNSPLGGDASKNPPISRQFQISPQPKIFNYYAKITGIQCDGVVEKDTGIIKPTNNNKISIDINFPSYDVMLEMALMIQAAVTGEYVGNYMFESAYQHEEDENNNEAHDTESISKKPANEASAKPQTPSNDNHKEKESEPPCSIIRFKSKTCVQFMDKGDKSYYYLKANMTSDETEHIIIFYKSDIESDPSGEAFINKATNASDIGFQISCSPFKINDSVRYQFKKFA